MIRVVGRAWLPGDKVARAVGWLFGDLERERGEGIISRYVGRGASDENEGWADSEGGPPRYRRIPPGPLGAGTCRT